MALRNPTYNLPKGGIGYRRLLSETEFLKVKQRARVLQKYGTDIDSVYIENQTVMFKTRSAEYDGNKITYTQRVYIEEASFENVVKARNFNEIERIMRDGGLKVHCNCLAKGTRILTKTGFKNIEDITTDDFVLSSDGKWHKVAGLRISELKDNWKKVKLQYRDEPLVITTDHKIMRSDGEMRTLNDCKEGDKVQGVLCPLDIISIEDAEPQVGYDVCLFDEPHNYIANGVIVSNCPAFTFYGYKYKAWNMGYGLEKEFRRPIIRNPHNRGYVCKHLYLVLETFPFISKTLASRFKEHWQQQLKK